MILDIILSSFLFRFRIGFFCFLRLMGRDFCNQRSWWVNEDQNEYIIFNHSVLFDDCPEKSKFVRGWSHQTGYIIRVCEDDPSSCEIKYIACGDPKGSIPTWLVNKVTQVMAPKVAA